MNEELQNKILEYLNGADAFLKEQVPDYVKQLMAYEEWSVQYNLSLSVILLTLGVLLLLSGLWKNKKKQSPEDGVAGILFGSAFVIIGLIATGSNYDHAQKLKMAPKVYLIEKISGGRGCK